MWDVGRDGDFVIASSGIGDDSHREPVSRLQWVTGHDGKNKKHNVSVSHSYSASVFSSAVFSGLIPG